jgi:hypothetical protein
MGIKAASTPQQKGVKAGGVKRNSLMILFCSA